jgi:hypothetical protein
MTDSISFEAVYQKIAEEYGQRLAQTAPGQYAVGAVNVVMNFFVNDQFELLNELVARDIKGNRLYELYKEAGSIEAFKKVIYEL